MRFITFNQLKEEWRFPFTRVHTMRLVRQGKFPAPFPIGVRHIAWDEDEVVSWYKDRRMKVYNSSPPNTTLP